MWPKVVWDVPLGRSVASEQKMMCETRAPFDLSAGIQSPALNGHILTSNINLLQLMWYPHVFIKDIFWKIWSQSNWCFFRKSCDEVIRGIFDELPGPTHFSSENKKKSVNSPENRYGNHIIYKHYVETIYKLLNKPSVLGAACFWFAGRRGVYPKHTKKTNPSSLSQYTSRCTGFHIHADPYRQHTNLVWFLKWSLVMMIFWNLDIFFKL